MELSCFTLPLGRGAHSKALSHEVQLLASLESGPSAGGTWPPKQPLPTPPSVGDRPQARESWLGSPRLDICSFEKSLGSGSRPGSLLSLLSRNNRREDASKCFWLPWPGCLSARSADILRLLWAEGLPSESSAGTLWVKAMVSKGTKWPAEDASRWCPDKPGLCPGETSLERAADLCIRQESGKGNWGWLVSLQMNDREQWLQCWGRAVYTGIFPLNLDKLEFWESGWFLPQFLPPSKGDNHPEDC